MREDLLHPLDVSGNQVPEIASFAHVDRDVRKLMELTEAEITAVNDNAKLSPVAKAARLEELGTSVDRDLKSLEAKHQDAEKDADIYTANLRHVELTEPTAAAEVRLGETRYILRGMSPNEVAKEIDLAKEAKDEDTLRSIIDAPRIARFGNKDDDATLRSQAHDALLSIQKPQAADIQNRLGLARKLSKRNLQLGAAEIRKALKSP